MRPLGILHTESSLGWGGQEIRILSEAQGMIERGHQVRLLCAAGSRILEEAPSWNVPAYALPIDRKSVVALKCMYEWLKLERCHVVSTHSSTDSWLVALSLFLLRWPCAMVRTRHISVPVSRGWATRWLYTRAARRIVTTGEALRRELVERNRVPGNRVDSIPTGVDAQRFRPGDRQAARQALGLPAQRTLIGIVATLRSWKGHKHLIEAMAGLPAAMMLVIVGEGPMRGQLESLIRERNLADRVLLAGNQKDVVPWLQALDVFVLPSYANEGVPQALLQAMFAELPCVTTHVGSIAEIAIDGKTALVVPPKDPEALRRAIVRLVQDEGLSRRLGEQARAHCASGYSRSAMLDRMEQVYRAASGRY